MKWKFNEANQFYTLNHFREIFCLQSIEKWAKVRPGKEYNLIEDGSERRKKLTEIIPSIFSDHNAVRLDLNYRRKTIQNSNIWRLNNTLLNNQQITEEIKKRNQNMHRNKWKWKNNKPKPVGHCKSSAKGKVHSNTGIPQETRKKSNK